MAFLKKEKDEEIYERTELEKKFEETGRKVGEKTGKLAQKGIDQYHKIVSGLEESGKMDKVREAKDKAVEKTDEFFSMIDEKVTDAIDNITNKNKEKDE